MRPLNTKQYTIAFAAIVTIETTVGLSRSHPLRRPRTIPGMSRYSPASLWCNSAAFFACMPDTVSAVASSIETTHRT
jgi:hypothetical protein